MHETEFGKCRCGCGSVTTIARQTDEAKGIFKGLPQPYVGRHRISHRNRMRDASIPLPNPNGDCFCGCGLKTPLAPYTRSDKTWVKGEHLRYFSRAHHGRSRVIEKRWEIYEPTGCWNWLLAKNRAGYGVNVVRGRVGSGLAHVQEWVKLNGPMPVGKVLDHLCLNRGCVNPEHLEPVTQEENIRRSVALFATIHPPRPMVLPYARGTGMKRWQEMPGDLCWPWRGALNHSGYGYSPSASTERGAHRYVYRLLVGEIPPKMHLDHLCYSRWCVRPDHLEPVTPAENNRRSWNRRRALVPFPDMALRPYPPFVKRS